MHTNHSVAVEAQHPHLNHLLWGMQGALALTFLVTGTIKVLLNIETVYALLPWASDMAPAMVRVLGAFELAAVWGLTVPGVTHTITRFVSTTAWSTFVMMLCAIFFHLARGEAQLIMLPTLLALASAVVAIGRAQLPISHID
jgi:hypothetical protein